MKVTLELSAGQIDFLKTTGLELSTQDNRHTHIPIFRIYENIKVEKRDGCGDHLERLDYEGAEEHYCVHCTNLIEKADGDIDAANLPVIGEDGCGCNYLDDAHWTYDVKLLPAEGGYDGVAFLTEKAAQDYLESNHYHFNKGVVYAESAFRNHELIPLREILQEVSKQL